MSNAMPCHPTGEQLYTMVTSRFKSGNFPWEMVSESGKAAWCAAAGDLLLSPDTILARYFQPAAPADGPAEQDADKVSAQPDYLISACYFPKAGEVELSYERVPDGGKAFLTLKATPEQGKQLVEVIGPCVYFTAQSAPAMAGAEWLEGHKRLLNELIHHVIANTSLCDAFDAKAGLLAHARSRVQPDTELLDFVIDQETTWYPGRAPNGDGVLCWGSERNEATGATMREAIFAAMRQINTTEQTKKAMV